MDPLLITEILEANPDWTVRYLADNQGILFVPDSIFEIIIEDTDLEEE